MTPMARTAQEAQAAAVKWPRAEPTKSPTPRRRVDHYMWCKQCALTTTDGVVVGRSGRDVIRTARPVPFATHACGLAGCTESACSAEGVT